MPTIQVTRIIFRPETEIVEGEQYLINCRIDVLNHTRRPKKLCEDVNGGEGVKHYVQNIPSDKEITGSLVNRISQ